MSLEDRSGAENIPVPGFAGLTDHRRLDEAPGVGLGDVGLEHARGAPGLVHASKHVDLPPADRGRCRMHRFGQRADGFPLVGYCVVPGEKEEQISERHFRDFKVQLKNSWDAKKKSHIHKNFEGI